jgi:hypothetical protein
MRNQSPIERVESYLARIEQLKSGGYKCAGWRLKVKKGGESSATEIYDGAFLPFAIGKAFPEILARFGYLEDYEYRVLHQKPDKGPVVLGPNLVGEVSE